MTAPSANASANGLRRRAVSGTGLIIVVAVLALACGFLLPYVISSRLALTLLSQALFDSLLASSVGVLFLLNGRVSFGQAAYFGLGGYTLGVLIARKIVGPELAILLAIVLPTLVAFFLGLVIARVTGVAHAMLTLAVGQAFYEVVFRWRELAKGDDGMAFDLPSRIFGFSSRVLQDPTVMVVLAWTLTVVVLFGLALFARSRLGQVAAAIRENEERARFIGYETVIPRALVYAIAALIAALAGILQAIYNAYIAPEMFHWSRSGAALIMAIVGGAKFIVGPAIGALVFFFIKDVAGRFADFWPAIVGAVLVVVTVTMPQGIVGLVDKYWRRPVARKAP